jgi:hypothetical protein
MSILSFLKYSSEDIRIDNFRKFLGIGQTRIRTEILDCFLILLKNLPISFYKLFLDFEESNSFTIYLQDCLEIYINKFPNFFIHLESFNKLISACHLIKNNEEIGQSNLENKKHIFYLLNFKNKQKSFFNKLILDYKLKEKIEEDFLILSEQVMIGNKDFNLNLNQCKNIFNELFEMKNEKINLEKFCDFFLNIFIMKLNILDFVHLSLEIFNSLFSDIVKKLTNIWEKNLEAKNNGIIFYKDFEIILSSILYKSENKWKFSEYFKYLFLILCLSFNIT